MKYIIGVDIGGTYVKSGLLTIKGRLLKKIKILTESKKGRKKVIDNVISTIQEVYSNDVVGIGIGCPGTIDLKKGIVINSPNLPFNNLNLLKTIKKEFDTRIIINNDAKCFAFAEAIFGAGKGHGKVIGLTLGTGVGGGVVYNKKLIQERMTAMELGHTVINYNGPRCACNNYGCLEEYVSARGIMRRSKGIKAETPLQVFELAKSGNKKAISVLEETGSLLGIGISNFINIFDPDIIVIGGDISKSWAFLYPRLMEEVKKRALFSNAEIVQSKLKNSGIIGAWALLKQ